MLFLQEDVEISLQTIHNIATENLGSLCITKSYRPLQISLNTERYESARQKVDLAAVVLQDVGVNRHGEFVAPLLILLLHYGFHLYVQMYLSARQRIILYNWVLSVLAQSTAL